MILFMSCVSECSWSKQDKAILKNNVMVIANADPAFTTNDEREKFCNCLVEKMMTSCPDPDDQVNLPTEDSYKQTEECRKQALNN